MVSDSNAVSRRCVLLGTGAGVVGLSACSTGTPGSAPAAAGSPIGGESAAPAGERSSFSPDNCQPGIADPAPTFVAMCAFNLVPHATVELVTRLLRLWTEDSRSLMSAQAPLADPEPELAHLGQELTITVGLGPGFFAVPGLAEHKPEWLAQVPPFSIDQLQPGWTGGDLVVQVCGDDHLAVSHAARTLRRSGRSMVTPAWVQRGFRSPGPGAIAAAKARGEEPPLARNAFGQVDGTINLSPHSAKVDAAALWLTAEDAPAWLVGGTSMVVRRIAMDLAGWDRTARPAREETIGRTLATGAPLTGGSTTDAADFGARYSNGALVIHDHAHMRRAHQADPALRMLRRGYTFEQDGEFDDPHGTGLIFVAFQRDFEKQFVAVQRTLAQHDLLNEWTTPIGSAVAVVPPRPGPGEFLAQGLVDLVR